MRLSLAALSLVVSSALGQSCSGPDPLDFHPTIGMQAEYVGSIPTNTTDAWSYNMMVQDNFDDGTLYFLDQLMGKIYSYDESSSDVSMVFDMSSDGVIPDGVTLDWTNLHGGAAQTQRVHAMSKGSTSEEVYVVLTSTTLPTEYSKAHAQLPAEGAFPGFVCAEPQLARDLYRIGDDVDCGLSSQTIYNVFVKYTVAADGQLGNPVPFFSLENQLTAGHLGGGITTLDDGRVLWSVGDCLPYGSDGRFAPQLNWEHCGKILLINPTDSTYKVVAKGVRNSQQFRVINRQDLNPELNSKDFLVFMDIGGVTAEEVNAIPLTNLLDTSKIDNFGWGRNLHDGKAREGTFYVAPGTMGVLGTEPPCEEDIEGKEPGHIQPWIQFGRTDDDYYYAISSFAVAYNSFDKLELIWSEFNTGNILGTNKRYYHGPKNNGPVKGHKIKLYDSEGNYLENGVNDLVKEELGEVGYYRGDPRLFHFSDGTAGVFVERTGKFYKLTEIAL